MKIEQIEERMEKRSTFEERKAECGLPENIPARELSEEETKILSKTSNKKCVARLEEAIARKRALVQ